MTTSDILGNGLVQETINLEPDDEGPVVATLVHRACKQTSTRAFLYIHGFNDYYFNTELADRVNAEGHDFYALDLRKYGRSFREGQTLAYIEDITTYYEEIDAAVSRIRERDGHCHLTLLGHSTGGLTSTLYAADRPGIDALILNSPFYDLAVSSLIEGIYEHLMKAIGAVAPRKVLSKGSSPYYAWSLHRGYNRGGEWDYNREWKRKDSIPLRAGWLRAVVKAQERVQAGLDLSCPGLVLYSQDSVDLKEWDERAFTSDLIFGCRRH